jgi:hypothetical protein
MSARNVAVSFKRVISKGGREICESWRNADWWRFRLPSLFVRALFALTASSNDGLRVMAEDWDTLIILDACRYDVFKEVSTLPGTLREAVSRGSHTWMFMKENFMESFPDTVCVSSNPFIWDFRDSFHQTIYVAPEEEIRAYGTVLPETVRDAAFKAHDDFPDKRLIVHFLQPHDPFIGAKTGALCGARKNPFHMFARGELSREAIWEAYRENLRRVLPSVLDLIERIPGKTVVTSDHGESFGAYAWPLPVRIYGHSGPRIPDLTRIPWLTITKGDRRAVRSHTSAARKALDEDKIREHLKSLGYM